MAKHYLLGIDAGGTKTDVAIADESGNILVIEQGGPGSFHFGRQSIENIKDTVAKAAARLKTPAVSFVSAFIGAAGIDCPEDQEYALKEIHEILKPYSVPKIRVDNDIHNLLHAGLNNPYGAALVSGTGTNCYGVTIEKKEARASGMGHILTDQGSGYWIGLQILQAAVKSYDGRGPKTQLESLIAQHFQVSEFRNIVRSVYAPEFGKTKIASLAALIDSISPKEDAVVKKILNQAVDELFYTAKAVLGKLFIAEQPFELALGGSILAEKAYIRKRLARKLKKLYPQIQIIVFKGKPVLGAIKIARSL
ncbi:MAG: hypothetical protein HY602_00765 [Parcubacteria group bacterium]|nr:hypothetical protein [Parcubacteria group bacterium]